ncbi:MAG: hypothetical protein KDD94_05235 [Calditrichaeota bacterium]|nr:hypothetical protein [Calditrichota bacterium]
MMVLLSILFFTFNPQEKIWIKVNSGSALYLNPYTAKWVPINGREEIPVNTYIIIKDNSDIELFRETEVISITEATYFFLADAFVNSKYDIMLRLARIEAEQFPLPEKNNQKRQAGLIYGANAKTEIKTNDIPNIAERKNAVEFFIKTNHYASALLSQKRMMSKFPSLYSDPEQVNRLFILYDYHQLNENIYEESKRLLNSDNSDDLAKLIKKYHTDARLKLKLDR